MQEIRVRSLGWEDPPEKEMATYSSILAWRIPWTEEPGGLQSMVYKELDKTEWLSLHGACYNRGKCINCTIMWEWVWKINEAENAEKNASLPSISNSSVFPYAKTRESMSWFRYSQRDETRWKIGKTRMHFNSAESSISVQPLIL